MIKSRKELATALSGNKCVEEKLISKSLSRVVEMWITMGESVRLGEFIVGNF